MVGRATVAFVAGALALAGCGRSGPPVLPSMPEPDPAYVPRAGSGNGFDDVALAALEVESRETDALRRVAFGPDQRERVMKRNAASAQRVVQAGTKPFTFEFRARTPEDPAPFQVGWRLLSRILVWRIQDALEREDLDAAIRETLVATRFGFDLAGGGATDASLGFTVVDESRRALAPSLARLGTGQLNRLADGMDRAMRRMPAWDQTVDHEAQNMKVALGALQRAYAADQWSVVERALGDSAKDPISHMRRLRTESSERQAAFFNELAGFMGPELEAAKEAGRTAAVRRREFPEVPRDKPWRRLARAYLTSLRGLVPMRDRTLARTRMTILTARLMARLKNGQPLPERLEGDPMLVTDPYTGRPFLYRAQSPDFDLYSAGENFQDDGGETDTEFLSPDLRIERE